LLVYIHKR